MFVAVPTNTFFALFSTIAGFFPWSFFYLVLCFCRSLHFRLHFTMLGRSAEEKMREKREINFEVEERNVQPCGGGSCVRVSGSSMIGTWKMRCENYHQTLQKLWLSSKSVSQSTHIISVAIRATAMFHLAWIAISHIR